MKTELCGPHITIEADKIAEGFVGMLDEEETTILRFGMLPAKKMELLEKQLREKFASLGTSDIDENDLHYLHTRDEGIIEFSVKDVTRRAMRLITNEIYARGNLVV